MSALRGGAVSYERGTPVSTAPVSALPARKFHLSQPDSQSLKSNAYPDERLPGKGNSHTHGARPVHVIIKMIRWIRTSRLSTKNYLSALAG